MFPPSLFNNSSRAIVQADAPKEPLYLSTGFEDSSLAMFTSVYGDVTIQTSVHRGGSKALFANGYSSVVLDVDHVRIMRISFSWHTPFDAEAFLGSTSSMFYVTFGSYKVLELFSGGLGPIKCFNGLNYVDLPGGAFYVDVSLWYDVVCTINSISSTVSYTINGVDLGSIPIVINENDYIMQLDFGSDIYLDNLIIEELSPA